MPKLAVALLLCITQLAHAQHNFFVLKKRKKVVTVFSAGSYMAFVLNNRQWYAGYVEKVEKDSMYFLPVGIIYHFMSSDTVRFNHMHIAYASIYAVPKEGFQIDYINGQFDINRGGGHVHWYWVKGGWLFRTFGAGYALLNVTNNVLNRNPPFAEKNLGTLAACAGLFVVGEILKYSYKPYYVLGNRYRLEYE